MKKLILFLSLIFIFNNAYTINFCKREFQLNPKLMYFFYFSRNDSVFDACVFYHLDGDIIIDSMHIRYVQLYKINNSKKDDFISKFRKRIPSRIFKMTLYETKADFECKQYGKFKHYYNGDLYIDYYFFNFKWTRIILNE